MNSPSRDQALLTARKDVAKYFHDQQIALNLQDFNFELIGLYLANESVIAKTNILDSLWYYLKNKSTSNYYVLTSGIKNLIKLFNYLLDFIDEQKLLPKPSAAILLYEKLESVFQRSIFRKALSLTGNKLQFHQIAWLDTVFRKQEKETVFEVLSIVYDLDVYESLGRVVKQRGFCFPEYLYSNDVELEIEGLFHPKINEPVINDVSFNGNENVIILSGSNMSGKSSLLKALGLAIYLSHIGFPVPAARLSTVIFYGLMTTINLPDDIDKGYSHFYTEVKRVKLLAEKLLAHEKMFVIIDELFRGTNVTDAFDASLLIISALSNIKNSFFIISTHIVELVPELRKYKNISFKFLETKFEKEHPEFTFKLKDGVSEEKFGMFFIKNEGIVDIINSAAKKH